MERFRSRVKNLFLRSRNWNEDGAERLRSRVNGALEDFPILDKASNDFYLWIHESLSMISDRHIFRPLIDLTPQFKLFHINERS